MNRISKHSISATRMRRCGLSLLALMMGVRCATSRPAISEDPHAYLEEVEGASALGFAREENDRVMQRYARSSMYNSLTADLRKILLAKDRLPNIDLKGDHAYNFWMDQKNLRGLWRRTTLKSYATQVPKWEVVLDLDELAKSENENWVWKGAICLGPKFERCLLRLSRGGKDAVVVREFDLVQKRFVADGFVLSEAKSQISWIDDKTVYVGTDFGPESLTEAGYPRIAKIWQRGTPLTSAEEVFRGEKSDVRASCYAVERDGQRHHFCERSPTFFSQETSYSRDGLSWIKLSLPRDAEIHAVFKSELLFSLRSGLTAGDRTFPEGSLLSIRLPDQGSAQIDSVRPWFIPDSGRFLLGVTATKSHVLIQVLVNVTSRVFRVEPAITSAPDEPRTLLPVSIGGLGYATVSHADPWSDLALMSYQDFLTPQSVYSWNVDSTRRPVRLKSSPSRFSSRGLRVEQHWAVSKDGTQVPYFQIALKSRLQQGAQPTLLYGYGGFEISQLPFYWASAGKVWLERGGVLAIANIRGGGEFGPAWHKATLRENRLKSFEDFEAIAEDLLARKVASRETLGIMGGSNGGLLTATVMVRRPELFGAVISQVPLTDMLRYHKLLAGSSWMEEYGNPDDPNMRKILAGYSPYQNAKSQPRYPEALFTTSTKDDRVHPGHARKMVARLKELGQPVLYFENIEGGHGGAANLEQRVKILGLEFAYLWDKLKPLP